MTAPVQRPNASSGHGSARVKRRAWGRMPSGALVHAYELTNARGTAVTVLTLGAIITSIRLAGRGGTLDDVVLGMTDVEGYLTRSPYFGAVTGRFGNRIARGRFTLDGVAFQLATNNPPNHLHGGVVGFDKHVYTARAVRGAEGAGVRLTLTSPDGDEGYPGEVHFAVRYLLGDDDRLTIDYEATTTRATPINPSQHTYWNLAGAQRDDILDHRLQLNATRYTPVDATLIPTGELAAVEGTPFDFRTPMRLGARIGEAHQQLQFGHGYDHNFVVEAPSRRGRAVHAATLHDPLSGRTLDVYTTEPGVQLYTGNWLDGTAVGKGGRRYAAHAGVCLETQHFPDAPNQPHFPSTIVRPGRAFRSRTVFAFSVR
ncbi:MAG: galactose mutarotase [Gemmatimonadaceae bacterium]|nr:galactose mutarotase [Gemmatimonadaceae bacterium]